MDKPNLILKNFLKNANDKRFFSFFVRFLLERNVYYEYKDNLIEYYKKCDYTDVIDVNKKNIIDRSFNWASTTQGHDFWMLLHNDFKGRVFKKTPNKFHT